MMWEMDEGPRGVCTALNVGTPLSGMKEGRARATGF